MSEARQIDEIITVEEFLEGEIHAEVRHEYVDGQVYAMAGASDNHGLVSGNFLLHLKLHLRGSGCQTFQSDMKVHCREDNSEKFYYPDVVVSCDPDDRNRYFRDRPTLVVEVLSQSTWMVDHREKVSTYQQMDSIEEIVLVSPDWLEVTIYRRENQWQPETFTKMTDVLILKSVNLSLPLTDIYEGVALSNKKRPWYLNDEPT